MNKLFNKNYLSNANKIKKELELLDFLEKKISKIE